MTSENVCALQKVEYNGWSTFCSVFKGFHYSVAHWMNLFQKNNFKTKRHPTLPASCLPVFDIMLFLVRELKRQTGLCCHVIKDAVRESRHDFMANDSRTNISVGCRGDNQVELS